MLKLVNNSITFRRLHNYIPREIKSNVLANSISEKLIDGLNEKALFISFNHDKKFLIPKILIEKKIKNLTLITDQTTKLDSKNLSIIKIDSLYKFLCSQKSINLFLEKTEKKSWNDEPCARLFSIVNDYKFIRNLFYYLSIDSLLFSNGKIEFYFLISEKEFKNINQTSSMKFFNLVYELFFDYVLIDKYSCSELNVSFKYKGKNRPCYFVKLTPKQNLKEFKDLAYFYSFLKIFKFSNKSYIIKDLEKHFPGIGFHLIKLNYQVFTKTKDLNLIDFIKIFELILKEEKELFFNDVLGLNLEIEENS